MSMGGGGGGGGGSQTTQSEVILPDWVQSQVQQNIGQANTLAAQPYQQYTGPTLAGFTPDQLASFQAVRNLQGTATGQIGQAYDTVANLPQSTQSLLNPYMGAVGGDVTSNMLRASNAATQDLDANAANVGAFGGTRTAVQQGVIDSETQRNIGQAINTVASQGWNTAMGTALQQGQTMGQLASAGQTAGLQAAGALNQVGTAQQTLQQAQYANALQQWQQAQNYPYQQLAIAQSALAGSPYGATVTSSQPYNTNTAAQDIGLISSAIPILGNIGNYGTAVSKAFSSIFG